MTDCRIYAACLASYNNGRLHGVWIDADQDEDSINAEIRAMLKASPYPNVMRADWTCTECGHDWTRDVSEYQAAPTNCPSCESTSIERGKPYPSAEEFAIHDHEGFGNLLGEYSPISEVVRLAEAIEEHGDKYVGLRNYGLDHDEAISAIEEDYCGEYDDLEDWAAQTLDDQGFFGDVPKSCREVIERYFDFKAYGRDCEMGGDIRTVEGEGRKIHVFYNR